MDACDACGRETPNKCKICRDCRRTLVLHNWTDDNWSDNEFLDKIDNYRTEYEEAVLRVLHELLEDR